LRIQYLALSCCAFASRGPGREFESRGSGRGFGGRQRDLAPQGPQRRRLQMQERAVCSYVGACKGCLQYLQHVAMCDQHNHVRSTKVALEVGTLIELHDDSAGASQHAVDALHVVALMRGRLCILHPHVIVMRIRSTGEVAKAALTERALGLDVAIWPYSQAGRQAGGTHGLCCLPGALEVARHNRHAGKAAFLRLRVDRGSYEHTGGLANDASTP